MPTLIAHITYVHVRLQTQISISLYGFPVKLIDSVHQLPNGQERYLGKFLSKFKLQIEVLYSKRQTFGQLVRMVFRIGNQGHIIHSVELA